MNQLSHLSEASSELVPVKFLFFFFLKSDSVLRKNRTQTEKYEKESKNSDNLTLNTSSFDSFIGEEDVDEFWILEPRFLFSPTISLVREIYYATRGMSLRYFDWYMNNRYIIDIEKYFILKTGNI